MALIDHTFFVGEINLPGTNDTDTQALLAYFIESHEDKLLQDLLGYALWKAMEDGLGEMVIDQRWLDIRDGKEYTGLDGYAYKWMGLKQVYTSGSTTIKKSLIANYVYWLWQQDNVSQTATLGEAKSKTENATIISPKSKMIRAWNEMADWICELKHFLDSNLVTYPEWQQRNNYFQLRKYRKQNHFDI